MLSRNGDDSETCCWSLFSVVVKRRTMVPSGKDRKLKRVSTKSFVASTKTTLLLCLLLYIGFKLRILENPEIVSRLQAP